MFKFANRVPRVQLKHERLVFVPKGYKSPLTLVEPQSIWNTTEVQ
jgi:hypothetical protein